MELIKKAAVGILTAAMIAGCGSSSAAAANTAACLQHSPAWR